MTRTTQKARVALVHDWLTGMRGGERCLEVFCELLPDADLFTLVHVQGSVSKVIEDRTIHTSFVDRLPLGRRKYRSFLPLFPKAIESFDLSRFDLVVSLSHCVAKGARPRPGARHVCYCFTPMRYVWDMYHHYFPPERLNVLTRRLIPAVAARLRAWDAATASRADRIVAISNHVRRRIERFWRRDSELVYPPVDTARFMPTKDRGDFFLMVGAFAPYKRVDLALEAFRRFNRRLKIVGTGQDEARLRDAAPPNVEFLGWKSDDEIAELYSRCSAFVFPGEEDFGITPLEAQAAGRPVIALGCGGALETVAGHPGFHPDADQRQPPAAPTGILYPEQTADSLLEALRFFEKNEKDFDDPAPMRANAARFSRERFIEEIRNLLAEEGAL